MHIESQLDSMFSPTVTLKSGGYIVINQTEALVSIDVNSGRATREHSIEETARKTNLEAASEIGRQLRLRDLAGLIVIDFIDMEDGRNDREVEKRLRDAVKNDRARVQIGKISQFGLMEMSRQRLRAGVMAGSTVTCPHCGGIGLVRSTESTALRVLRALEEEGEKSNAAAVTVKVSSEVALYVLNQKRHELARIETEHGMEITFVPQEAWRPALSRSSAPRAAIPANGRGNTPSASKRALSPPTSRSRTMSRKTTTRKKPKRGGRDRHRKRRGGESENVRKRPARWRAIGDGRAAAAAAAVADAAAAATAMASTRSPCPAAGISAAPKRPRAPSRRAGESQPATAARRPA